MRIIMMPVHTLVFFFYNLVLTYIIVTCIVMISVFFMLKKSTNIMHLKHMARQFFKVDLNLILLFLCFIIVIFQTLAIKNFALLDSNQMLVNFDAKLGYLASPLIFGSVIWYLLCIRLIRILSREIGRDS
jgi:hypothetical protein